MKKINWKILIISFTLVFLTAYFGSSVTNANTSWYDSIKPAITPPNIIFPIVWTILFILIALSIYLAYTNSKTKKQKIKVRLVFISNLILNFLWSYLFFGNQNPKLAFIDIIALWLSIITMLLVVRKSSKTAFWMLIPYLLWVSFAIILNYLIIQ
ncbi:MAG: TspO/MBR family protein [archaeon]|nr:TspO/MBR family protein [archaeon]